MAKAKKKAVKQATPPATAPKPVSGMRCYLVTCGPLTRVAGTNALARAAKAELVEKTGRKKSGATIEDHLIPYGKPNLIAYLNQLRGDYEQQLLDSFNPPGAATQV